MILIAYFIGYLGALFNLGNVDNLALILFILIIMLMNDFLQAIFGFVFGKHKITPKISPNKTIEGFIGGIIGTTFLTIWIGGYAIPQLHINSIIVLGVLLAIFGFWGDITLSAIKRYVKVKDSSNILPGHGGILDRFDSLLYSVPLLYFYVYLLAK